MQEEARVNLASKMSTLASKHSLAFENLTSAVADARKFRLPGDIRNARELENATSALPGHVGSCE
jgi:hypothetical protein